MMILSRPDPRHFTWRASILSTAYMALVVAVSLAVDYGVEHAGHNEFANPAGSFVIGFGAYWFPPLPWLREKLMSIQRRTTLSVGFGFVMAFTVWAATKWLH